MPPMSGTFRALLQEFAADLELGDLDIKDESYYCFGVDDDRVLHFRWDEDSGELTLFIELGVVPATDRVEVAEDLLRGNVFGVGSRGAALGLDPETGVASLTRRVGIAGATRESFRALVESFLETANDWAGVVGGRPALVATSANGEADFDSGFMRV